MSKICGIYRITSPTGKIYIGQSIDIKRRLKSYRLCTCKEQPFLFNSIKKYGWESHIFEVIQICLPNKLNKLEKYYVDLYNTFNSKDGMNLRDGGGSHGAMSDNSKRKMSISRTGGKRSDDTKRKMSESAKKIIKSKEWCANISKGKKNPTEEVRCRIGMSSRGRKAFLGRKHSQKSKDKISQSKIGKPAHNRRPVIDINTGIIYPCKKYAADSLHLKVRTLKAKLEGKIKNNTPIRYYEQDLIQRIAGHSSVNTTSIYTHISHNLISKIQSPLSHIRL